MTSHYLAGIDIGTTGAKTAIFDLQGKMIASGYREYTCQYPHPNWVEQDAELLVAQAIESAREAVSRSGIDAGEIGAIGLSTQRCCSIFVDGQGKLLRPMISWQDNRTEAEVADMRAKISDQEYYQLTGTPMGTTWILSKILWVRKNEPEVWSRLDKVVQLQDFVLKALGAEDYFLDIPDAAFYGIWDTDRSCWHSGLMEKFDICADLLPKPTPSGMQVGVISDAIAERTGFKKGTPLCVGAGDQNSAVVGAGIVCDGRLSVSIGTGGIAIAHLDKPFRDPQEMSMITNHAIPGKWQMEGLQAGAAGVFRWFRDELGGMEKVQAAAQGSDVYSLLDEEIAATPPGAKGLVFLPYMASANAPRWDPQARGTLIGLTFAHDRACVARAFLEGITLEMKDIVTSMLQSGIKIDTVHIMGGATKSPLWNQMQADMYNLPVSTLRVTDAAVLGAALLAGVGFGVFRDVRDGVSQMVAVNKTFYPEPKNARVYNDLYGIYVDAYEGLTARKVYHSLAVMQAA